MNRQILYLRPDPARVVVRPFKPATEPRDLNSKVNFCNALREAGGKVEHVFVFFFYDIFREGRKILEDLGVTRHWLATWWDVLAVAKESGKFDKGNLAEVETFMRDPTGWSKANGGVATAVGE
jgi:orotate phosphoribosyltransferase